MTQYSAFGTHGNAATGPSSSTSYGGAFTGGMAFSVTSPGYYLLGYYMWRSDSGQSASASFALWQITASETATYLTGTNVSTSGMTTATWNYVALGSPYALTSATPYKAVYGLTGNFNDTHDQFNGTGTYPGGVVNGPLNVYSDVTGVGGTNPIPFAPNYQGTFGTAGTDPTVNYPTSDDVYSNFWIDVLIGPASAPANPPPPPLIVTRPAVSRAANW